MYNPNVFVDDFDVTANGGEIFDATDNFENPTAAPEISPASAELLNLGEEINLLREELLGANNG